MATFNERLARAFIQQGDEVTIYTFSLQYPGFLFPGKTQFSTEEPPADLSIKVAVNSINPLNWLTVGKEIKRRKPDLVVIRYWMPFMAPSLGSIARIIRKNKHTKVVAIADNIVPHEKMPGSTLLSRYFVNSCDGFITMSRSVLADLQTFNTSKPGIYTPHPLYDNFGEPVSQTLAKQKLGLDDNVSYILFFGFIREYKGLDLLLKAFADNRFRSMKVKLLIAGEYYIDRKPFDELIKNSGIANDVILHTSFIENSDIVTYFCAADMVAQPYRSATQSGVTQIAYHFGKPILTTNVGGLAETVLDGKVGYVVNPDPDEICNALLRFYNENKLQEFTENALIERKRFSWSVLIENISKVAGLQL
jgi:glycosyltransferase involved in cell wall biosynthesis